MEVILHPLVVISISDHYTRTKANKGKPEPVVGCLMGVQTGRKYEIMTAFEMIYTWQANHMRVDVPLLKQREEQLKTVFPDYSILGWYSTTPLIGEIEQALHRDLSQVLEGQLILLTLDPTSGQRNDLPIVIYEAETTTAPSSSTAPNIAFKPILYKVETIEPERISVDGIAKTASTGAESLSSQYIAHLLSMKGTIQMLLPRIKMIRNYIQSVSEGKAPADHSILRTISSIMSRLPVMNANETFEGEYLKEYLDGIVVPYLTTLTNTLQQASSVAEKVPTERERRYRGHGGFM